MKPKAHYQCEVEMGIQKTREQLLQVLADPDNKVVALTGKWGTGKTHLFREIREASADTQLKEALSVSLFGLRDMAQVKLKLIQNSLPGADERSSEWKAATQTFQAIKKVLVSANGGFSAIDELALLAVPKVLRKKLIVLDDIERKHPDLSIDEVLGFIDEFTQEYDARFVLILNSDQLEDQELWKTLTEKVVDQEVRLLTTPDEAFTVAALLTNTRFSRPIHKAVLACNITNIRVVRKIIKATNRILGDRDDISVAVLARVVPSAVLLAATNYRGIDEGPTIEYILATGNRYGLDDDDEQVLGEKKSRAQWDLLLSELGIVACDEFELLVADFLRSGLIDSSEISTIIDRYGDEQESFEARQQIQEFLQRIYWDHRATDEHLLESARGLVGIVPRVDAGLVSALSEQVSKLHDGNQVADALVDAWIAAIPPDLERDPDHDFLFQESFHPRIKQAFDANAARAQAQVSVLDVCIRIFEKSSWGTREELAMRAATPADFERTIQSIEDIIEFRKFMRKMLDFTRNKAQYEKHFGSAMDNFVEACRRIMMRPDATRLPSIVRGLFSGVGLQALLDPTVPQPAASNRNT